MKLEVSYQRSQAKKRGLAIRHEFNQSAGASISGPKLQNEFFIGNQMSQKSHLAVDSKKLKWNFLVANIFAEFRRPLPYLFFPSKPLFIGIVVSGFKPGPSRWKMHQRRLSPICGSFKFNCTTLKIVHVQIKLVSWVRLLPSIQEASSSILTSAYKWTSTWRHHVHYSQWHVLSRITHWCF